MSGLKAMAEDTEQFSGVNISITSDKDEYSAGEDVNIEFTIDNQTDDTLSDMEWSLKLPDGLILKNGKMSAEDISVNAGETLKVTAAIVETTITTAAATTATAASSTKSVQNKSTDSPKTDDDFSLLIPSVIIIFAIIIAFLTRKKSKKILGLFAFIAIFSLITTSMPLNSFAIEKEHKTAAAAHSFKIESKEYSIELMVDYYIEETNDYQDDISIPDTDKDGINDNTEVKYGLNPDVPENKTEDGNITINYSPSSENDSIQMSINISMRPEQLNSFEVNSVPSDDFFLSDNIPGYMGEGSAYDFSLDGSFAAAELTYTICDDLLSDPTFIPAIYHYNEEEQFLEEQTGAVLVDNKLSLKLEHFSKYILINKNEYDKVWAPHFEPETNIINNPDSDEDGLSDYYEKAMASGKLRFGNGSSVAGTIDLTQMNYQDPESFFDGLSDGEVISVIQHNNGIVYLIVSPKIFLKNNNIVERAHYLYNITWDCKTDVDGWRQYAGNHYSQGNSYHIPYGQPVHEGKYVYYGIPISDFIDETKYPAGDFYLKRSLCYEYDENDNRINVNDPNNKNSVYYAIDCSAFASYCWDLPQRKSTGTWSSIPNAQYLGDVKNNISKIEPGDVLNRYEGPKKNNHIVVVTSVDVDNNTYEIIEATPKELLRNERTEAEVLNDYGVFKIYRNTNRHMVRPHTDSPNSTSHGSRKSNNRQNSKDVITYNGHIYQIFDKSTTWTEAKTDCEEMGGHLATITDADEEAIIESLVSNGSRKNYWLGGTLNDNNKLSWITDEEVTFYNWASGQPDNRHENCLMIYNFDNPYTAGNTTLKWNDLVDAGTFGNESWFGVDNFGYICEWED